MADALVIGAGVAGLGTAVALSQRGWDVTIVERDATTVPESPDAAFEQWERRGAPQVRHSHAFLARLRNLLRDSAPEVLDDLLAAGATEIRFTENPPPELEDRSPRPGDEDLVALACRRTTFEWVLRRDALDSRGVRLVEGAVGGLLAAPGSGREHGPVHVTGVRLTDGRELSSSLVVDAGGRRSPLPSWLEQLGTPPLVEQVEDTGIVYSTRFYRLRPVAEFPPQDGPIGGDLGYLKYAVFLGDNRTFSVTFGLPTEDAELRRLLQPEPFTVAARSLPVARPWIDGNRSEPITGVDVMARLINRLRRFVAEDTGEPVATGIFAVGDSNICTNPLYGRGCSLALVMAYLLADALDAAGDDAVTAAVVYDEAVRREVEPWYRSAVTQDRQARGQGDDAEMGRSLLRDGLLPAARRDPVVNRAFLRSFNLLDPPEAIMQDADVLGRILTAWQDRENRPPPEPLGPERDELLRILDEGAHS